MIVKKSIELVGPNKGKDIVLGGIQFRDGKATLEGPDTDVEKQFRYLHRCWQVQYSEEVSKDGSVQDQPNKDENGAPQGNGEEGEGRTAQEGSDDSGQPTGTDVHNQNGQTESPVVNQRLVDAVSKLDPENEEHWTRTGKPAMSAIETFYGSSDITRADVDAAAPGLSRDSAKEKAKS